MLIPVHQPIAFDTGVIDGVALYLAGVAGIALDGIDALPVRPDNKPYMVCAPVPVPVEKDRAVYKRQVHDPAQFDVIMTENMFGAILSDEASMVTGSIGMLSSASLNETKFGLYEPSHGSAPDIAGQNKANPIATILSAAMLLRYSLNLDEEADAVEAAVQKVLTDGYRTGDIMSEGCKKVGTKEMGDLIAAAV